MTDLMNYDLEIWNENDEIALGKSHIANLVSRESKASTELDLLEHGNTVETHGESGDEWESVERTVEQAISVMEEAFPYVQLKTRNEVWNSLHRCYQRAKSIRKIRGVERIEDCSDAARYLDNKCMLGVMI